MTVLVSGLALIGAFGIVAAGSAGLIIALYRVAGGKRTD
jgi:hypothetical protein